MFGKNIFTIFFRFHKNLFSSLAAQDKLPQSEFKSKSELCTLNNNGEPIIVGVRQRGGGLYKLVIRVKKTELLPEVNSATGSNMLQLLHKRFGQQNKRYVQKFAEIKLDLKLHLDSESGKGCIYGKAKHY